MLKTLNLVSKFKTLYLPLAGVLFYDYYYADTSHDLFFLIGISGAVVSLIASFLIYKPTKNIPLVLFDLLAFPLVLFSSIFFLDVDLKLIVLDLAVIEIATILIGVIIHEVARHGEIIIKKFSRENTNAFVGILVLISILLTILFIALKDVLIFISGDSSVLLIIIGVSILISAIRKASQLWDAEEKKKGKQTYLELLLYISGFAGICACYFFVFPVR